MKRNKKQQKGHFEPIDTQKAKTGILEDIAKIEGKTPKKVCEEVLTATLLTENQHIRCFIERMYRTDGGIIDVLDVTFNWYAAGLDLQARYSNGKPLVKYLNEVLDSVELKINLSSEDRHHFINCWDNVCEKLAISGNSDASKRAQSLISGETQIVIKAYIDIVLDNWACLGNYTYTFRALSDLMSMASKSEELEISRNRLSLRRILFTLAEEWRD